MWGKPNAKVSKIETLIGNTIVIRGDLIFSGGLHIDGKIIGNVIAEDGSNSMLVLSDHGSIEGEVRVPYVVLNGEVIGDVYATERVELSAKAQVNGNVFYNLLEMALGSQVNGNLVHCKNEKKLLEFQRDHNAAKSGEEAASEAGSRGNS
ncbi:MAG TPA: polymer-forming cytoskeletal protein [Gammaproteobacteria bacterium]|nr:polymer-forming cytoskeletal protein [Gammaproteobacteria bacterium]